MFYVAERLKVIEVVYKLIDFTTKEEQSASRDDLKERILSGETIVGASIINDNVVIKTKGKIGEISLADYAILTERQYLIDEFDCEANNTTPDKIPYGRKFDYNWICPEGHPYSARLAHRTYMNSGCPYCHNQKVLKGFNDFETWCKDNERQDLLAEWDYEENIVDTSEILPFSNKKYFWICSFGHRYSAVLDSRTKMYTGCSKCYNQTSFPEQAVLYYLRSSDLPSIESRFRYQTEDKKYEIDIYIPSLNVGIEYDGVNWHGENKIELDERKNKVLSKAGIKLIRMREEGCPIIEAYNSKVIIVKNLDIAIKELFKYLSKNYGVSFIRVVNTKQDRSNILAEYKGDKKKNSIAFTHPNIAKEWAYDLNEGLKPDMFSCGSGERVWWRCSNCNIEYQAAIYNRCIILQGCKKCNSKGNNQFTQNNRFKDKYKALLSFIPKDKNKEISKLVQSTEETINIVCPDCNFEEKEKHFSARVRRQRGLTCKKCNYHIDFSDYVHADKVVNEIPDLAAGFAEFLKNKSNK